MSECVDIGIKAHTPAHRRQALLQVIGQAITNQAAVDSDNIATVTRNHGTVVTSRRGAQAVQR